MFAEVQHRTPQLAAWMESCYSCQPLLHLGEAVVVCSRGTPWPIRFCPNPPASDWASTSWHSWTTPQRMIPRRWDPDGLSSWSCCYTTHCRAWSMLPLQPLQISPLHPGDADPAQSVLPPDIPTSRRGFTFWVVYWTTRLLRGSFQLQAVEGEGHPWGPSWHGWCSSWVHPSVLLPCPPQGLLHSLCLPSLPHPAHCCRDWQCHPLTIIGSPVSHWSWLKASLPCSRGGLNLCSAVRHSTATLLASISDSKPLVHQILGCPRASSPHISSAVSCLATESAHLDWQRLDDIDVILQQNCLSHVVDDPFGDHQVGCGGNGDRIAWHNTLRNIIYAAAQSAALVPFRETPGLVPGSQARPGDIFLPCWSFGRPSAFDVLVISPLQELTVAEAAQTPGRAL